MPMTRAAATAPPSTQGVSSPLRSTASVPWPRVSRRSAKSTEDVRSYRSPFGTQRAASSGQPMQWQRVTCDERSKVESISEPTARAQYAQLMEAGAD
eukprot:CAMPEP_0174839566 /NCGR_PEP_ID=MMETSP1114-20130205/8126_1 /TAXON_ID=312471 /ORGANISM="Neobodo designis, Strain CCAP 1951/1" /LENGTH=96 /DNA_ID=CAMNT_0016073691 /DNA_START=1 /DNA_END=288 /DNA_ORIENTATION=-